ncbi:hypothetical protein [Planctomyces sp. SH-PL62]|uniref:hypothetical protein n=1 Tax=Planctomyces sp. SH-PL62 TaxID=1636152 RepID=UPI00078E1471|nr:hypothetical protein [Planctomyces sp. SH-PL62]AMV37751.1 hypothetical protein VT85_09965 [Planctomyces sp. SH-PL62]
MSHSKRLLGLPRRSWFVISPALIAAAALAPWPGAPEDPAAGLFREPLLVAHTPAAVGSIPPAETPGELDLTTSRLLGDRVVPYGRHEGTGPVFALALRTTEHASIQRPFGWSPGSSFPGLGFFRRRDVWRYALTAVRYDEGAKSSPSETWWLPDDEAAALRPLAVAELDRRSGSARRGAELARLLDEGAERESWLNWPNGLVLAAWLSIPVALWACVRPKEAGKSKSATEEMQEAFP